MTSKGYVQQRHCIVGLCVPKRARCADGCRRGWPCERHSRSEPVHWPRVRVNCLPAPALRAACATTPCKQLHMQFVAAVALDIVFVGQRDCVRHKMKIQRVSVHGQLLIQPLSSQRALGLTHPPSTQAERRGPLRRRGPAWGRPRSRAPQQRRRTLRYAQRRACSAGPPAAGQRLRSGRPPSSRRRQRRCGLVAWPLAASRRRRPGEPGARAGSAGRAGRARAARQPGAAADGGRPVPRRRHGRPRLPRRAARRGPRRSRAAAAAAAARGRRGAAAPEPRSAGLQVVGRGRGRARAPGAQPGGCRARRRGRGGAAGGAREPARRRAGLAGAAAAGRRAAGGAVAAARPRAAAAAAAAAAGQPRRRRRARQRLSRICARGAAVPGAPSARACAAGA